MTEAYWEELSKFESRDFVVRWYKNRHDRELNAGRAHAITTCFSQGREYFDAARLSSISVRPLLLYYGVLSLSRGVILFRDKSKGEESLKPSHGIDSLEWGETLSKGLESLIDVKIRATKGTFSELVLAVGNQQWTGWRSAPSGAEGRYYSNLPSPKFLDGPDVFTLDDLLSRDHRFMSLYSQTTARESRVHLGEVWASELGIDVTIFANIPIEEVAKRFGQPEGRVINLQQANRIPFIGPHFQISNPDLNAAKIELPMTQFVGNDGMFILENFSNGDQLSEILRTYLLAYILGMLVRYYPSKWMALLRNEKGDAVQPCLRATCRAIATDFPKLILQTLS